MFSKIILLERRIKIMNLEVVIHLLAIILGAISAGVPILVKWNKARKAKINAVGEAEKQKAQNEMLEQANNFIALAEDTFKSFDEVLKARNNGSAGSMKKESVLNKLQAFALSRGYEYDSEYWSKKIDEIVKFTKSVNSK